MLQSGNNYLGNPNLKRANVSVEWTEKQVTEYTKCMDNPLYFIENYIEILKIWKGGMSFHGGLLGVIIATLIFAKNNKTNFFSLADIISCVAPIGLFMGRIANFINGELIGKTTSLPWSVIFPAEDNLPRHPSQLYEAFLEGLLLFVLINYLYLQLYLFCL